MMKGKKKKIIFLVQCEQVNPSSHRRAIDYEPYLRAANLEPIWLNHSSPTFYYWYINDLVGNYNLITLLLNKFFHLFAGGLLLLSRWVSLVRLLFRARKADGIFIQWITPPPWYTLLLKRINPRIAFDFDDAVFLKRPAATEALVRHSKVVSVGSHYNLDYALKLNNNLVFLPTPVPIGRFEMKAYSPNGDRLVIGWLGSISTIKDLKIVVGELDRLAERHPEVVFRMGCGNRRDLIPQFKHLRCEIIPFFPYDKIPSVVTGFDIGIMPLHEEEFSKGKCAGKALEYMAAGIPAVLSRFGENVYVITDGVDGFLASTEDEWVDKLSRLVEDPELRQRIGSAGRQSIISKFSLEVCSLILINEVLDKIAG